MDRMRLELTDLINRDRKTLLLYELQMSSGQQYDTHFVYITSTLIL